MYLLKNIEMNAHNGVEFLHGDELKPDDCYTFLWKFLTLRIKRGDCFV
jgi:hypothetical protein